MSAISGVSAISASPAVYGIANAAREGRIGPPELTRAAAGVEKDPAADSVELTRQFPQLAGVQQTYQPQQPQQVASLETGGTGETDMDDRDDGTVGGQSEEAQADEEKAAPAEERDSRGEALDEGAQQQVRELKNRDREVRAHEQAHMAVGGSYSGGVSYEYQQGPDGQRYAVGGEVSIDTSAERNPESTISKMQQVKSAALAPADPSAQDRSVASAASQAEGQARQQLRQAQAAEVTARNEEAEAARESQNSGNGRETEAVQSGTSAEPSQGGASGRMSTNPYANAYAGSQAGNGQSRQVPFGYTPLNVVA